jgi:predicted membrane protein
MHSSATAPQLTPPRNARVLDLGRLLVGLAIVTLGVLFLLDSADVLNAEAAIGHWWPMLLVVAGIFTLLERPPSVLRGTLLLGAGVVLLLFTTEVLEENAWDYVWPALLVAAGVAIAARWQGHAVLSGAREEDVVRATAIFGGPKLASSARQFRGAWLTAIFGGITLDLRGACPAPDGASINVTAVFGGVDILVPKGWRISVRSTPIFGGLDDKTDRSEPPSDDAPALHVDAVTVFGGAEIKHGK